MQMIVTGAAGFVGHHTVAELRRRGHNVLAVVRRSSGIGDPWADDCGVQTCTAGLRLDADAIAALLPEAGALIHLAASSRGTRRDRFDATVLGTERLLQAVSAVGWRGRFVHVSSFAVCALSQLRRGAQVNEDTPLEADLGTPRRLCVDEGLAGAARPRGGAAGRARSHGRAPRRDLWCRAALTTAPRALLENARPAAHRGHGHHAPHPCRQHRLAAVGVRDQPRRSRRDVPCRRPRARASMAVPAPLASRRRRPSSRDPPAAACVSRDRRLLRGCDACDPRPRVRPGDVRPIPDDLKRRPFHVGDRQGPASPWLEAAGLAGSGAGPNLRRRTWLIHTPGYGSR